MSTPIYTWHTPAFADLFNTYWLPSIPKGLEPRRVVMPDCFSDVVCSRPDFHKWVTRYVSDIARANADKVIVVSGVDQFFTARCSDGDLAAALGDYECVGAADGVYMCSDLRIMRCTPRLISFLEDVADHVMEYPSDQVALSERIGRHGVSWGLMPYHEYWNVREALPFNPQRASDQGSNLKGFPMPYEGLWDVDLPIPRPPLTMKWFHANYTFGHANKIILLEAMRSMVARGLWTA